MRPANKQKKPKEKSKAAMRTVSQEWIDGVVANAEQRAYKKARTDMATHIKEGAAAATSHAFTYLIGIVVNIMADDFSWTQEECNWMVERMLEEYNKQTEIEHLLKDIETKSGVVLELDENEKYWL